MTSLSKERKKSVQFFSIDQNMVLKEKLMAKIIILLLHAKTLKKNVTISMFMVGSFSQFCDIIEKQQTLVILVPLFLQKMSKPSAC